MMKEVNIMNTFIATMANLPSRHPRRLALVLAQIGLFVTVLSFGISIAGMNIGIFTCLVGCIGAGAPLHRLVAVWAYLAYVALLYVSLGYHGMPDNGIAVSSIPLGLIVAQVAFHPDLPGAAVLRRWIMMALVVSVSAAALLALAQYTIGKGGDAPFRLDPAGKRYALSTGFFSIHLTQGAVMGLLFVLVSAIATGWWRTVGQVASAVCVGICGARGAVLGFAAAVAAMVAARGGRFVFIGVGIAVVMIFAAIGLMRLTQPERLDNSLAMRDGRWPIWQTSLQMIADQPLLGTGGPKNFKETYLRAYPQVVKDIPNEFPGGAPHAHNTQLSLSAEYGIPFALAWLIMLFVPLGHLYRGNPEIFRAGLGIVVMVLIFGQFEKLDGAASRVLWTSLGMLLSLRHQPSASPTIS
jgi:hypothetical protein